MSLLADLYHLPGVVCASFDTDQIYVVTRSDEYQFAFGQTASDRWTWEMRDPHGHVIDDGWVLSPGTIRFLVRDWAGRVA